MLNVEPPSMMGVNRFCDLLNSPAVGLTDDMVDLSNLECSVYIEMTDFAPKTRVHFRDRKTKFRSVVMVSADFIGRVTEGQVRGLVERAYFAALSNQQGSVMVPQQEVAPFVQGVVSEAMVSVFTGQLSQ